jgi:uncharacterized membrane protein YcaP (DUF421 family)
MRRNYISIHDLEEDLRLDAKTEDPTKIRMARVERSGDISFIMAETAADEKRSNGLKAIS